MDIRDVFPPGFTIFVSDPEYCNGTSWRSTDGKQLLTGGGTVTDGVVRLDGVKDSLADDSLASGQNYRRPEPEAARELADALNELLGSNG